jgi:hypothetical protein
VCHTNRLDVSPESVDYPSRRRLSRSWIYVAFFAAWQACAFPLYRAEWSGIRLAAQLWHSSADNRKVYADGAVYPVLREAQVLVPLRARVLFVNPAAGPLRDYYWYKTKYYLWPRRIEVVNPASLSVDVAARADAVIVFDAERTPVEVLLLLNRVPSLRKASESFRDRSGLTVYDFESRGGRSYEAIFLRNP